jgi:hypothetical protein
MSLLTSRSKDKRMRRRKKDSSVWFNLTNISEHILACYFNITLINILNFLDP